MSILGILAGEKGDIGVEGLVLPPDTRLSLWLVPMGDLTLEPESKLAFEREGWTAGLKSPLCDFFLLNRPIADRALAGYQLLCGGFILDLGLVACTRRCVSPITCRYAIVE